MSSLLHEDMSSEFAKLLLRITLTAIPNVLESFFTATPLLSGLLLGCSRLLQAAAGCSWLLLAAPGLAAAGCSWLLLWLLLAAPGCSWLLVAALGCS